jgi:hypothetical protein
MTTPIKKFFVSGVASREFDRASLNLNSVLGCRSLVCQNLLFDDPWKDPTY